MAGEAKNPQKAIPLALIGSIVICILLYTLVQVGFIGAIPNEALSDGWAQLHFPGDAGPFVGIAAMLGLHWLIVILYTDAVISPFGSALVVVTTSARLDYAMGVNGYGPKWLTWLNSKEVPHIAILLNFLVGSSLVLLFPGWQGLASFILAAMVISHTITPISLVTLRKQMPNMPRPFRVPAYRFVSFISFLLITNSFHLSMSVLKILSLKKRKLVIIELS